MSLVELRNEYSFLDLESDKKDQDGKKKKDEKDSSGGKKDEDRKKEHLLDLSQ